MVSLGNGVSEADLLVHDETAGDPTPAYLLSRMRYPDLPEPIGVLHAVERPTCETLLDRRIAEARRSRGRGDLQAPFNAGDTWRAG